MQKHRASDRIGYVSLGIVAFDHHVGCVQGCHCRGSCIVDQRPGKYTSAAIQGLPRYVTCLAVSEREVAIFRQSVFNHIGGGFPMLKWRRSVLLESRVRKWTAHPISVPTHESYCTILPVLLQFRCGSSQALILPHK